MANVTINDNTEYAELDNLCEGDYFILSGELYIVKDKYHNYRNNDCGCFNLSDNEATVELDPYTKVLPVPSDKVKIKVEI